MPDPCLLFALQKDTQADRARMRAAVAAEAMRECTFAPRTNESRNRSLIQRILASSDDEDLAEIHWWFEAMREFTFAPRNNWRRKRLLAGSDNEDLAQIRSKSEW